MGLIRMFVGIEPLAKRALQYLERSADQDHSIRGLEVIRRLDAHVWRQAARV